MDSSIDPGFGVYVIFGARLAASDWDTFVAEMGRGRR